MFNLYCVIEAKILNKNGRIMGKTTKLRNPLFQSLFKEPPEVMGQDPKCHKIIFLANKKNTLGKNTNAAQRLRRRKS